MSISFNHIKENISRTGDNSISSVFSSLLFKNIDDISDYNPKSTYNKGDIVYINKDIYPYHFFYECKMDRVTGIFDETKWSLMSLDKNETNMSSRCIGDIKVIYKADRIPQNFDMSVYGVDSINDQEVMVFLGDELVDPSKYICTSEASILFMEAIDPEKSLKILSIDSYGEEKYNSHKSFTLHLIKGMSGYIELLEDVTKDDKVVVFTDKGLGIEGVDYELNLDEDWINVTYTEKECDITVHVFSHKEDGELHNVMTDRLTVNTETSKINLNIVNFNPRKDGIIIYSSLKGAIPASKIFFKNGRQMILKGEDKFYPGEVVQVMTFMKDTRREKYRVSISNFDVITVTSLKKMETNIMDFDITKDEYYTIDISSLGSTNNEYTITWEVIDARGFVDFIIENKENDRFDVRYTGMSRTARVIFKIDIR